MISNPECVVSARNFCLAMFLGRVGFEGQNQPKLSKVKGKHQVVRAGIVGFDWFSREPQVKRRKQTKDKTSALFFKGGPGNPPEKDQMSVNSRMEHLQKEMVRRSFVRKAR